MKNFMNFTQFINEQTATPAINTAVGQAEDEVVAIKKQIADIEANIANIPNKNTVNGAGVVTSIMKSQLAPAYQKLSAAIIKKADSVFNKVKSDEAAARQTKTTPQQPTV